MFQKKIFSSFIILYMPFVFSGEFKLKGAEEAFPIIINETGKKIYIKNFFPHLVLMSDEDRNARQCCIPYPYKKSPRSPFPCNIYTIKSKEKPIKTLIATQLIPATRREPQKH